MRRVLHIMRLPMGGLFRHVRDLVMGQQEAGIAAGVICAEPPVDGISAARLAELEHYCGLGLHTTAMARLPGFGDLANIREAAGLVARLKPDVIHGHGAKGGLIARLVPAPRGTVRVYTPHGGSLHYDRASLEGLLYHGAERLMRARTDGVIFESAFSRDAYLAKIGTPKGEAAIIHNGVSKPEFEPVATYASAADFLFIGELRMLKGVSTLIEAASMMGRPVHIRIAGAGPDRARFEQMAREAPSQVRIEFLGAMPAREAFRLARTIVMPSWNESFPYVVLEAAAAGVPLIATRAGGIPEIFGPAALRLLTPADAAALAGAMNAALADPAAMQADAMSLRQRIGELFTVDRMVESVGDFYESLAERKRDEARRPVMPAASVKAELTQAGR
ncbi:MAG: glycosyltransferase family 4 protein [Parvibaculaceae bacterium]|nr:glycosyltransferase family 4 protein [Parvibaculaceae bacterium]